ncbi:MULTISPECIES: Ref family recombination enhancement nuclease [Rhizobium]|uniref:Ref family recombination enhancement nuclease n=1 Tax=Rhizobium TaxID=379 RepID=UPI001981C9E7|nr:Ref family recombination enhancement nuclease [Rhizobium leguminosarum]
MTDWMNTPQYQGVNSSDRQHLSRVAALGCIVVFPDSGERCCSPAEIHHPRDGQGMGQRADHSQAIPLCFNHHSGQSPLPYGHAIHKGMKTFEARYGTEAELLARTRELL